jgi:hypothetical protein
MKPPPEQAVALVDLLAVENLTPVIQEASDNIGVSSLRNNHQVIETGSRSWPLGSTNSGSYRAMQLV